MSGDLFGETRAVFSPCRTYRYVLTRTWKLTSTPLVVIGLNPSTADETKDDPTIRRCIGFAKAWGHGGLVMLNLYAYRSTDPDVLSDVADPIGPENDLHIAARAAGNRVICAWGCKGEDARADAVLELLRDTADLACLGRTKDGGPRHPLYVRADKAPEAYP